MNEAEVAVLSKALTRVMHDVIGQATVEIRERLVGLETRAAVVSPELGDLRDRVLAMTKEVADARTRLAVVETREPVPGPPGPAGPPGKDGTPGLRYRGVWVEGKTYGVGDMATWAGSCWHCNADETTGKPGDGAKDWTLMVKAGRDVGRDTRDRGRG